MPQGICALCNISRNLQQSHYIPKGVYKAVGNSAKKYESQLVHIDVKAGTACYSNGQPTLNLLCFECEQRFSVWGETEVIPQLRTYDSFPLRDEILRGVPDDGSVTLSNMGKLDYQSYAYFALSIIWRGSVAAWPSAYGGLYGKLKLHEGLFRRYLVDCGSFPHRTFISVIIDTNDQSFDAQVAPSCYSMIESGNRLRVFAFQVPGVIFRVFTGARIGQLSEYRRKWLKQLPIPIGFIKTDFSNLKSYQDMVKKSAIHRPVGKKLLKQYHAWKLK